MAGDYDNSTKTHLSDSDKRRAQDFDDLQHELAGVSGRIARFFNQEIHGPKAIREKRVREEMRLSALDALLASDRDYAILYRDVSDWLRKAEAATERALDKAETALDDLVDRAAKLPDGRAVFLDKNGNARFEGGAIVDVVLLEGIVWPEKAPTFEAYEAQKNMVTEIREYQVDTLGAAREKLSDEHDPLSKSELEEINQNIEDNMPKAVAAEMDQELESPSLRTQSTSSVSIPKL